MAQVSLKVSKFEVELICSGEDEDEVADWITDNYLEELGSKAFEYAEIVDATYDEPDGKDEE